MLVLLEKKADTKVLQQVSQDLDGYIKFVVDTQKGTMTAGGLRHFEGEQLLLQNSSRQSDLWGGGVDLQTKEIDFDSMINIRPDQGNPSREVLDPKLREQIKNIVSRLLIKL